MIERHALSVLTVGLRRSLMDSELPALHSDPFDRLLVAQAMLEDMTLVTDDSAIKSYVVSTLW